MTTVTARPEGLAGYRPDVVGSPATRARTFTRWLLMHGVIRAASARAARADDPHARLMHDPALRAQPWAFYDEVRARGPLVAGRLTRVTATHAVASEVLRSEDFRVVPDEAPTPALVRRLAAWARDPRAFGPIDPPSMLAVEPPDHTRYRRLVSKVFTARAVEGLRARTQAVADDLLDRLADRPQADLVTTYAGLLPISVISAVLGMPAHTHARVLQLGNAAAASLDVGLPWREFRQVDAALREFQALLGAHLAQLRREPGDDLFSQLVQAEDESGGLTDTELLATAGLLLAAGFETTVNLLSSATVLLVEHPEQLALLRADPALWPGAVEEALRLEGPVQMTGRVAAREVELAGQTVPRGALIITYLGGANRDPEVFDDPHTFDVRRPNAREHLTFSAGRHFCLGAALARLEGEVGLRSLFERFPDLALDGPGVRRGTRVLRGWEELPVRLTARPAEVAAAV